MSSTEQAVASWTPIIVRGKVFHKKIAVRDGAGAEIPLASAQIDVIPNVGAPFSWSEANLKLTKVSPGTYSLSLTAEDTAALAWDSGIYRLHVIEMNGDASPRLIEDQIFAKDPLNA